MYAETSIPFVSRTRATLRSAEFGFFGVCVRTWVQTPRFWGAPFGCIRRRCFIELKVYCSAGALVLAFLNARPLRTSWLIVGTSRLQRSPGTLPSPQLPAREAIERARWPRLVQFRIRLGQGANPLLPAFVGRRTAILPCPSDGRQETSQDCARWKSGPPPRHRRARRPTHRLRPLRKAALPCSPCLRPPGDGIA